jgi:hypothetical protein
MVIEPVTLPAAFGAKLAVSVALWPGVSVVPLMIPVALIPAPLDASPEMVKLEFPVFDSVSACVADAPTFTLPNAILPGDTLNNRVVAIPVPLSAIDTELSDAVDPMVTAPLTFPTLAGWKPIVSAAVAPALSQYGVVIPKTENPLPLAETLEIDTPRHPVFFIWTLCVFFVPNGTSPNCAVNGVAVTYPALLAYPEPVSATATVPFAASLISFNVPEDPPTFCGVKRTSNVAVAPALRLNGILIPLTANPPPVTASPESVTVVFPVFAIITLSTCVRPTGTRPKFTAFGVSTNCPFARAPGIAPAAINARRVAKQGRTRRKSGLLGLERLAERTWGPGGFIAFSVFANAIG